MPFIYDGPYSDKRPYAVKEMTVVSFSKVVQRDTQERAKLLAAAEKDGFFYLDLSGSESDGLWETYQESLGVIADWFEKPIEEKAAYAFNSDTNGYKYLGSQAGPIENTKDGFETLRVAPSALQPGGTQQAMPAVVQDHAALLGRFVETSQRHVAVLLSAFSDAHGLAGAARYEALHAAGAPSNSSMSFHRYPRCSAVAAGHVGHNKHTDAGSLTVLFAAQWGLQVQAGGAEDRWEWVRPRPGLAVCNVGDSLRFLSGRALRSVVHRVVPSADQERAHRYSVGWFCRPAHGVVFRDSEGRLIQSDAWFAQKFDVMRGSHAEQRDNTLLTGGMEDVARRAKVELGVES